MEQRRVRVTAGDIQMTAVLSGSKTADLVWSELPIQASGSTWGDEIYFRTPIQAEEENAQEVVDMGDVAFWPPGQALCFFFGPTPLQPGRRNKASQRRQCGGQAVRRSHFVKTGQVRRICSGGKSVSERSVISVQTISGQSDY